MGISAQLVKELRQKTGAGILDSKKALEATDGDIPKAIEFLQEKGVAKAAKKANRIAAEGLVHTFAKDDKAIIVEINSETDYVALNNQFKSLIAKVANGLIDAKFETDEEAVNIKIDGKTITELTNEATATIGEKISFRRAKLFTKTSTQNFGAYVHANGQIASLILVENGTEESAKNVAMHVTAMNPEFMDEKSVPVEKLTQMKQDIAENANLDGKPENIKENILKGMLRKALSEMTLTEQAFVMESKQTVKQYLSSQTNGSILKMIRFEVGEGIEKNVVDFAAEVAAQMKG